MLFIVVFSLKRRPSLKKDTAVIGDFIRDQTSWARLVGDDVEFNEDNVWMIRTDVEISKLRDNIWECKAFRGDDLLFVAELNGNWGSYNISDEIVTWLNEDE